MQPLGCSGCAPDDDSVPTHGQTGCWRSVSKRSTSRLARTRPDTEERPSAKLGNSSSVVTLQQAKGKRSEDSKKKGSRRKKKRSSQKKESRQRQTVATQGDSSPTGRTYSDGHRIQKIAPVLNLGVRAVPEPGNTKEKTARLQSWEYQP